MKVLTSTQDELRLRSDAGAHTSPPAGFWAWGKGVKGVATVSVFTELGLWLRLPQIADI